jgi:hypothetical protein
MNNSKPDPTNAISRDAIFRKWPMYQCLVRDRLIVGADTYGDTSFLRPPSELLSEIAEELMDVTGWAFILWCRIQELQQNMKENQDVS